MQYNGNSAESLWSRREAAGVMYPSMRIHPNFSPNSCSNFTLVQGGAQLEHGSYIVKVVVEAIYKHFMP